MTTYFITIKKIKKYVLITWVIFKQAKTYIIKYRNDQRMDNVNTVNVNVWFYPIFSFFRLQRNRKS